MEIEQLLHDTESLCLMDNWTLHVIGIDLQGIHTYVHKQTKQVLVDH
jgi:hypothetical protein